MNASVVLPEGPGVDSFPMDALMTRPIHFLPHLDYDTIPEEYSPRDEYFDRAAVLTAEEERQLFEQMHLAYYRADAIRKSVSSPGQSDLDRVERMELKHWLVRGDSIRNRLLVIFHKLTVSIAKRFVGPRHALAELVSEGDATLLRAITLYDPTRGFRFSTYATHALRRRLGRYVNSPQHAYAVPVDFRESPPVMDRRRWTLAYERAMESGVEWLDAALRQLSGRERYIVRCRFGWGRDFEPRTLQDIAVELGISRERVRQLESRALDKLRRLAATTDLLEA